MGGLHAQHDPGRDLCVSLSLPIGIALALGRQSDMPIIKWICVSSSSSSAACH